MIHAASSNVIPLGARAQHTLPIPLRNAYRAEIDLAFLHAGVEIEEITSLFAQRWLSLTQLIDYLGEPNSLQAVWKHLGATNEEQVQSMILRVAFQLRFEQTNAKIYEITPDAQQLVQQRDAAQITCRELVHCTTTPVYIQLPPNRASAYYLNGQKDDPIEGGFFQFDNAGPEPLFYYQIHAKSSAHWHPSLCGNIKLTQPNDSLAFAAQQLMPGQPHNQSLIQHMLMVWASWATRCFTETAYMEHDVIEANGISNKISRLSGAYNRIILDQKVA